MLGAFMGYLFSGGDAGNVSLGGSIGQSGMAHNYLSHTQLEDLNTALENCEAQSTGCSEVERHAIMELYWQLSQEQDRQLASCMSQACIDWHTNRAANMVDAENIIGGSNAIIMYQLAGIENDFRNAQATAYQNLAVIEDYANFVDVRCSGTHSAECMQSYDAASNRIARLDALGQDITTVLAFVTSLGTAGAAAGLGQCVRSAHCAMRLARDIADGFGAEYAGQLTLVSAAGMGGRYVLQYGDEVVGFIDDLGDGIRVVSQIPGAERIVFDSASNTHGYFDNAGQWVDTWTVPTQIDVTFPTNIQHLLPPPANGGARPKRSPDGQYSNLYDGDTIVRDNPVRTLVQDSNGRYWLEGSSGQRITPSGQYNFVTMPDGTIRVTRPNTTVLENGEVASTHLGLSNGNSVNYAGSITFANRNSATRGSIRDWSNDSGHYQPAASDAGNAGLPTDLFNSSFD
jgi:hypothetical protein